MNHTPHYRKIGDHHNTLNRIVGNNMIIGNNPKANNDKYGNQANHIESIEAG